MAKLVEYPRATSFDDGDVILKDGVNGTKIMSIDDVVKSLNLAKNSDVLRLINDSKVTRIQGTENTHFDMNACTTPGTYRVESAADNNYIDNGPFSEQTYHEGEPVAGFKLIVMHLNSNQRIAQIVFPNATGKTSSLVAIRTFSTAGWGEWQFIPSRAYIDGARYVKEESDRVSNLVRAVQTPNSFTFIGISDLHYRAGDSTVKRALNDMKNGVANICSQVKIDYLMAFGDYIYRVGSVSEYNAGKEEMISSVKIIHDAFSEMPCNQIRLVGNHDPNSLELNNGELEKYFSMKDLYNFIGTYGKIIKDSENDVGSYGYIDLSDKKIRIIALNTSDFTDEGHPTIKPSDTNPNLNSESTYVMSKRQIEWFIDALSMDNVNDRSEWSIMIISHIPIDLTSGLLYKNNGNCNIAVLIKKYLDKQSGTINFKNENISYDFSSSDHAKILPLIFGHVHSYSFGNINVSNSGTSRSTAIKIHVPNALPGRESGEYAYPKTSFTAESTAFCVFVNDPDNDILYSYHYGAGIDRIVHYDSLLVSGSATVRSTLFGTLTWSTNNSSVVVVNEGIITAIGTGNALALATDVNGNIEMWNVSVA